MLRIRAWGMLVVMCVVVFAVCGCGGGSIDDDAAEEDSLVIPNDVPDTYDTQKVLEGTWRAIDSTYDVGAGYFSFRLNSAILTFQSTDIKGTVAQAKVTSQQKWYSNYTSGDVSINIGLQSLGLDFTAETGTMVHQGKDKWRCNIDGDAKVVMNITILSPTSIEVNYQGSTGILYHNSGAAYDFTLTYRKEEYL